MPGGQSTSDYLPSAVWLLKACGGLRAPKSHSSATNPLLRFQGPGEWRGRMFESELMRGWVLKLSSEAKNISHVLERFYVRDLEFS